MGDVLELTTLYVTFDLFNISSPNTSGTSNLTNSTNSSSIYIKYSPYYQHSFLITISFTLAYLFIFLLCMVGNVSVCLIVLRNRHMRTVTNLFILNLAISDLLVGIFCIPTTLVDNLITGWPFSNAVCKLSGLVQGISVCASVFTLVAIAVHRFRSIVHAVKPKITVFAARATIWLIWALALAIMLPSAVMLTVEQEEWHFMVYSDNQTIPLYYCYETWPNPEMRKVYTVVLFTHIYLLPLTMIMILYGCICAKLYSPADLSSSSTDDSRIDTGRASKQAKSQRKVKVIKMLIVVALLFMVSWLPLWTLLVITDYARPEGDQLDFLTSYIYPFCHWLAFSNSSVNPIIYGYFNENFKRGFQAACTVSCCGVELEEARFRQAQPGGMAQTPRDTILSPKPLTLGIRNHIYTGNDPTGCVCLEMKQKREEASAEAEGSGGGGQGEVSIKNSHRMEDGDGVTSGGSFVRRAWEV